MVSITRSEGSKTWKALQSPLPTKYHRLSSCNVLIPETRPLGPAHCVSPVLTSCWYLWHKFLHSLPLSKLLDFTLSFLDTYREVQNKTQDIHVGKSPWEGNCPRPCLAHVVTLCKLERVPLAQQTFCPLLKSVHGKYTHLWGLCDELALCAYILLNWTTIRHGFVCVHICVYVCVVFNVFKLCDQRDMFPTWDIYIYTHTYSKDS